MFFKRKNSMTEYGAFDLNSINQMNNQCQAPSYYLDMKFIRKVVIIVASFHVIAIGYFALEGFIKELFKNKEQSITVELTDFAAYSPVTSDGPQVDTNNEVAEETITDPKDIPTPNVTEEFRPIAAVQPTFNPPSLITPPKKPKPPKPIVKKQKNIKVAKRNHVKKTKENEYKGVYRPKGNPNGTSKGTSAQQKSYASAISYQLEKLWTTPNDQQVQYQIWQVVVKITVSASGRVTRVQVLKPCGNIYMNNSVKIALNKLYNVKFPQPPPTHQSENYIVTLANELVN